jgi:hypothetical protein
LWKSPKQIVKRIHCALAAGFTRPPSEIPARNLLRSTRQPNSPHENDVDLSGQKNGFMT